MPTSATMKPARERPTPPWTKTYYSSDADIEIADHPDGSYDDAITAYSTDSTELPLVRHHHNRPGQQLTGYYHIWYDLE